MFYQVYRLTMRDFIGDDFQLEIRGPKEASRSAALAKLAGFRSVVESVSDSIVAFEMTGIQQYTGLIPQPTEASNKLVIKLGYDEGSERADIFIPSPRLSSFEFRVGDELKPKKQPIRGLIDWLEDNAVSYSTGQSIAIDYAHITGKE